MKNNPNKRFLNFIFSFVSIPLFASPLTFTDSYPFNLADRFATNRISQVLSYNVKTIVSSLYDNGSRYLSNTFNALIGEGESGYALGELIIRPSPSPSPSPTLRSVFLEIKPEAKTLILKESDPNPPLIGVRATDFSSEISALKDVFQKFQDELKKELNAKVPVLVAPLTNTGGGSNTVSNPDRVETSTLTVSGSSTLSSATVSNLTVSGTTNLSSIITTGLSEIQGTSSASYGLFGTLQIGGFGSASYSRFGTSALTTNPAGNWITGSNDLLISGDLYGVGSIAFAGPASISNTLFVGTGGNTGNVGIGTTSPGDKLTVSGAADFKGTASASYGRFTNEINVGIGGSTATVSYSRFGISTTGHANYISTTNDLLISGDLETRGTASFGGVASVSGNFFTYGTNTFAGTGSSSFAGSLSVAKGFTAGANNALVVNGSATANTLNIVGGNVGIGTTGPTTKLEVSGGDITTRQLFWGDGTRQGELSYSVGNNAVVIGANSNHALDVRTNNANVMFITTAGNVGIGTTGPTEILSLGNGAARKFWIENTATDVVGRALTVAAGGTVAGTAVSDVVGGNLILQSGLGTGTGASTISFQTGTTLTTGTTLQTMSTKMTILGSGNVGIGTTGPAQKLHIEDAGTQLPIIRLSGTGNASGTQIGRASNVFSGSTAYDLGLSVAAGQDIWFGDGSTANLVIKESGNVGIGTTSPGDKLTVSGAADFKGTASASYGRFANEINVGIGGSTATVSYSRFGTSTTGHSNYISTTNDLLISGDLETRGTVSFGGVASVSGKVFLTGLGSLTDNRSVCASSTTGELEFVDGVCGTSSARFKENIHPLGYGLADLMKLNPVIFNYKNGPGPGRLDDRIGLIAEEVKELIPEVVKYGQDGLPEGIDYPNLIALDIKAIQEQQGQIASLSMTVEALMSQVALPSVDTGTLTAQITSILNELGVFIEQGLLKVKTLIASIIKTQELEVGSQENPSGITIYDEDTSRPHCFRLKSGITLVTPGKCGIAPEILVEEPILNISTGSEETPIEPTEGVVASPSEEVLTEPTPTPDPALESTPEPIPETGQEILTE